MIVSEIRKACTARLAEEIDAIKKHRASGLKVLGYTCHAFPAAVAAGLGLWPVRVLCGTSSDAESSGEKVVRPDVCPLVKSLLGNVLEKRGLHAEVDIWIGLYTCDQMRRGMNCLSQDLGKEVHPVQLPSTRTVEAADYYASQIRRFVSDIEARYNFNFNSEAAIKWQRERMAAATVLSLAARSGKISPLDLHIMFHLFFIARPNGLAAFFENLINTYAGFKSKRNIVLAGSPLSFEDTALLETLEKHGFSIIPLNCTGLNSLEGLDVPANNSDLPCSLAINAFNMPPCSRARPNDSVYKRISETLISAKASGLIVKCLKFCDHWYTERERMRRTFNIPVMVFDSDYAKGGNERVINRVEAFLETLS